MSRHTPPPQASSNGDVCEYQPLDVGKGSPEDGITFVFEYAHTKPLHGWNPKGYGDIAKGAAVVDSITTKLKSGWTVDPDSAKAWEYAGQRNAQKWEPKPPKLTPAYWRRRVLRVSRSAEDMHDETAKKPVSEFLTGTVTVFENERKKPIVGTWSANHLLKTDPSNWSDVYLSGTVDKNALVPPLPEPAAWVGSWTVADNWEYSACFRLGTFVEQDTGEESGLTRRRMWQRDYRLPKQSHVLSEIPSNHFKYLTYMLTQGSFFLRKTREENPKKGGTALKERPSQDPTSPQMLILNQSFATLKAVQSDHCMVCEEEYAVFKKEHHCRACYLSCCDDCSRATVSLAGYSSEVRCCSVCAGSRNGSEQPKSVFRVLKHIAKDRKAAALQELKDGKEVRDLTISGSVGTLQVCLKEGYAISAAYSGFMGFPNPQVDFYLCGAYVRSPPKTQTNNPVWGAAACTYGIPYSDPTATLFFSVYNVSATGVFSRTAIGRGAIPLHTIRKKLQENGNPNGTISVWVQLLPPRLNEVEGYEKVAPSRFRGCSSVCSTLGMKNPKRSLGFLNLTLSDSLTQNDALSFGTGTSQLQDLMRGLPNSVPMAYLISPSHKVADDLLSPQDEDALPKAIDRLKDSADRIKSNLALPYLLSYLWLNQVVALAAVPLWYGICTTAHVHHSPFVFTALVLTNGYLSSKDKTEREIYLFEEDNPYQSKSLKEELANVQMALGALKKLHSPVSMAASQIAKMSAMFSYKDPNVTRVLVFMLLVGSVFASLLLYLMSFFPSRLYLFAAGMVLICLPTMTGGKKEKPKESPTPEVATPSSPKNGKGAKPEAEKVEKEEVAQGLICAVQNLIDKIPDDRELVHQRICEGQFVVDPKSADRQ